MTTSTNRQHKPGSESFIDALNRPDWPRFSVWTDDGQRQARGVLATVGSEWNLDALTRLARQMEAGWRLVDMWSEEVCPGHLVSAESHSNGKGEIGHYLRIAARAPFWDVVLALEVMFQAWTEGDDRFEWHPRPDGHTPWCDGRDHGLFNGCRRYLGKVERIGLKTPAGVGMRISRDHGLIDPEGPCIYIEERIRALNVDQAAELARLLNAAVDAARGEADAIEPITAVTL